MGNTRFIRITDRAMGGLAASILLNTFNDLADENRTQYVYAAFFDSDYCKSLFAAAGVKYDWFVINARIAQRPRTVCMIDTETYTQPVYVINRETGGREKYLFVVENGYIVRIERKGIIYRLKHRNEDSDRCKCSECSYIMQRAIDGLHSGLYYLVEGV